MRFLAIIFTFNFWNIMSFVFVQSWLHPLLRCAKLWPCPLNLGAYSVITFFMPNAVKHPRAIDSYDWSMGHHSSLFAIWDKCGRMNETNNRLCVCVYIRMVSLDANMPVKSYLKVGCNTMRRIRWCYWSSPLQEQCGILRFVYVHVFPCFNKVTVRTMMHL